MGLGRTTDSTCGEQTPQCVSVGDRKNHCSRMLCEPQVSRLWRTEEMDLVTKCMPNWHIGFRHNNRDYRVWRIHSFHALRGDRHPNRNPGACAWRLYLNNMAEYWRIHECV